jgi:hypothetical protein
MVQVLSKKNMFHLCCKIFCSIYVIGHESIQPILSSSLMGCAFKARRHGFHWGTFNLKCMVMPSQVSMDDTHQFFFECTMGNYIQGTLYHPNLHSSMETKVVEEYVHFFTCEKDQVF